MDMLNNSIQARKNLLRDDADCAVVPVFGEAWYEQRGLCRNHLVIAKVHSNEHAPRMPQGSHAWIDLDDTTPKAGALYAIRVGSHVMYRLIAPCGADTYALTCENPSHPMQALPVAAVEVLGRVIMTWTEIGGNHG